MSCLQKVKHDIVIYTIVAADGSSWPIIHIHLATFFHILLSFEFSACCTGTWGGAKSTFTYNAIQDFPSHPRTPACQPPLVVDANCRNAQTGAQDHSAAVLTSLQKYRCAASCLLVESTTSVRARDRELARLVPLPGLLKFCCWVQKKTHPDLELQAANHAHCVIINKVFQMSLTHV